MRTFILGLALIGLMGVAQPTNVAADDISGVSISPVYWRNGMRGYGYYGAYRPYYGYGAYAPYGAYGAYGGYSAYSPYYGGYSSYYGGPYVGGYFW